jgi:hypothetical protein
MTKTSEKKEIKLLMRKCLFLWKAKVKERANGKCELCEKKKRLQAHHIEGYGWNKFLRYNIHNGVALCSTCHRFGRRSVHHSFCTLYNLMSTNHMVDLIYLIDNFENKTEITKEFLLKQIEELENESL